MGVVAQLDGKISWKGGLEGANGASLGEVAETHCAGVVQECRVEGAADRLISTEAECHIGHATADLAARTQPLDLTGCPEKQQYHSV